MSEHEVWIDRETLSLRWRQFRQELRRQKRWWLRRHTPYQAVFILATCRSGSNLLLDYLRKLPGVAGHSEVLCPLLPIGPTCGRLSPRQAIRHIRLSLQTQPAPIRGCKLMLHQLANCGVTLADLDRAFPDAKYLVLYRESLAEQFVSQKLAEATQQWLLLPGQQQQQARVVIEPAELHSYCDGIRAAYGEVLSHPGLSARSAVLSYEALTSDPADCLRQSICPLLNLPASDLRTQLRKQNTLGLVESVANYPQVAALLASPLCRQRYEWPSRQVAGRQAAA